jgi:hypothetical protein
MRIRALAGGAAALLLAGCAHDMGKQMTQGALEGVKSETATTGASGANAPAAPAVQNVTGSAVEGGLERLSDPEQLARLRRVVDAMVGQAMQSAVSRFAGGAAGNAGSGGASPGGPGGSAQVPHGSALQTMAGQAAHAFMAGVTADLSAGLGDDGNGPLARRTAAATQAIAAAAARGFGAGIEGALPGCAAGDARCLDRRVEGLSETAAVGFARGLRHEVGWIALALAFMSGMVVMAALVLGGRFFAHRTELPPRVRPLQSPA